MEFIAGSEEPLNVIEENDKIFIGRKKSIHQKYGEEGALLLGKSVEKNAYGKLVYLDAILPHVIFITGARGSGKSYSLGCIAEELVLKNPNVASVIIDPVGIFWSMKYPNRDEKELKELTEWGLEPKGIEQVRVFIPLGLKDSVPRNTYDKLFSLRPSELTVDDWCLTFGIERFSPTGLLLEKAIEKARQKYKNYSIDELVKVIETDKELTSKEKGFKADSRRALVSRLEAAKSWGVFSKEGTSLAEVCKKGKVSVIDISFLEENVASLVIGMLARKILNARKLITRQASMKNYLEEIKDLDELLDVEIPPTWLFIDEAHTLIPSGTAKTAATDALIEYVKQGRRPGCSLVFATQQPSAIDTKVLSQLDLLVCHKLVFEEDLKAVMKRIPTVVPKEYEKTNFIRSLPIGIALVGDRSDETSRAFCVKIRPRFSQHEGREVDLIEEKLSPEKLEEVITGLVVKRLEKLGKLSLVKLEEIVDTMNLKYDAKIKSDKILERVLDETRARGVDGKIIIPGFEEKLKLKEKLGEVKALKLKVTKEQAEKIAEKNRKKKKLGLIGEEEKLESLELVYEPCYLVSFNLQEKKSLIPCIVVVDDEKIVGRKSYFDLKGLADINERKARFLNALINTGSVEKAGEEIGITKGTAKKYAKELYEKGLADKDFKPVRLPELSSEEFSNWFELEEPKVLEVIEKQDLGGEVRRAFENLSQVIPIKDIQVKPGLKPVWVAVYSSGKKKRVFKFNAF